MDSNKSDYKWIQNLGHKLIGRVDLTIGDNVVDSYKFCIKCDKLTQCMQSYDKKIEFCVMCSHIYDETIVTNEK